jgi:serine O-acetyltransferase
VGAGSVVVRDVPPDSTVVGVPAHIVYQNGKRVLITDPHDVNDPLSDVIIALADEVKRLTTRMERLDGELLTARQGPANAFTVEEEERAQYRSEQASWSDHVSMGEGI